MVELQHLSRRQGTPNWPEQSTAALMGNKRIFHNQLQNLHNSLQPGLIGSKFI